MRTARAPVVIGHRKDSRQTFDEFHPLNRFVAERYVPVADIDTWRMWIRRDRMPRR